MARQSSDLIKALVEFRDRREWAQFHDVSRLLRAISVEAGELLETVGWRTQDEINTQLAAGELVGAIKDEAADVYLYLLLLADRVGFDLIEAAFEKIAKNELRYPVALAKGNSLKHTELKKD